MDQLQELATSSAGDERAIAVQCDVTEWDQVEAMTATALDRFGRIDAVFANAGFGATRGFLEESVEHWRSMVLTNVYGVALTIRATLPHLLERGDGHFLVTSSVAGRRALPARSTRRRSGGDGDRRGAAGRTAPDAREHSDQGDSDRAGMTDTDFFDNRPGEWALQDTDIAKAVIYALEQRPGVDVNEILIRPTSQPI